MLNINNIQCLQIRLELFIPILIATDGGNAMLSFDTKAALELITHSAGGFSYDTLARALISEKKAQPSQHLLADCREFCEVLESQGIILRCTSCRCREVQDVYYEYCAH
ncbi:hypothetical protein AB3X30_21990 [Raoultella terrigena]|uniref:hypothetical protein n=1 Tax=Raoultella terrigena TaxID=577 RepID=UPI00349F5135